MNMWTMIFLIVLVSCITGVLSERYKALGKQSKAHNSDDRLAATASAEAQREIADLRERIKVLERITTDANSSASQETRAIAEEIERLRDR